MAIVAGWYPDPSGQADHRWWDGEAWTDDTLPPTQPAATTGPGPASPSSDPAAPPGSALLRPSATAGATSDAVPSPVPGGPPPLPGAAPGVPGPPGAPPGSWPGAAGGPPGSSRAAGPPLVPILIAVAAVVLLAGAGIVMVVLFAAQGADTGRTAAPDARSTSLGNVDVFSLSVGDCFNDPGPSDAVRTLPLVACSGPFDNEVFALFDLPDGPYPGEQIVIDAAADGCLGERFERYVGTPYPRSAIYASALWPTAASWAQGDREVICFLYEPEVRLVGSQRGARR